MARLTFWDIIEKTIERVGTPLSPKEIWDKANELGITKDYTSTGKTPWATIGAYCYTDILRGGDNSTIIKTSDRPAQFFLRKLVQKTDLKKIQEFKDSKVQKENQKLVKSYKERDLHSILVAYAHADPHFKANLKTIFHESSSKGNKGQNEWLHPDLVGVYFPFRDYLPEALDLQRHLSISSIKLFSFELKIKIDFGNLRHSYFQAVSNSSWANEGYLVTLNLDEDASLRDEIRRLNNAFGIGLIQLNANNVFESEILFPARTNNEIDWDTVNRLASENHQFNEFLKLITEDCKLGKVKSEYDKILELEELIKFIQTKGF